MTDVFVGGFRTQTTGEQTVASYVWDTNSLAWVPQTASNGGVGTDVLVKNTNIPVTQSGTWIIKSITDPVQTTSASLAKRYEVVDSTRAYFGQSAAGTAESAAKWQIQELTFAPNGSVSTKYVSGSADFNQKWTDRTTLTYQ